MVTIKSEREIGKLREGGKILARVMKKIISEIKPGITTGQLENLACSLIKEAGGRPSFKGYKTGANNKAYPSALCISINKEVVHAPAIPSRRLNSGDIAGIDMGMEYPFKEGEKGLYTDMAFTVAVGRVSREAKKLMKVTKKSLELGIKEIKPGRTLNDMARAIQNHIEKNSFSVVRDLVGHGVGYGVHEDPHIPNFVIENGRFENIIFKRGMVLAIEPMVNIGTSDIKNGSDGFTIITSDGSLSAHFEHTIVVTEKGCEILTK